MEINHVWQTIFLGDKLFLAPIGDHPQKVIDLGTGAGIWAIDFADTFPSARVTGIDISPIQPCWVPPNCKFQVDDIEQPWGWSDDYFDYIHVRNLEGCIADWPRLYEQAFRHLRPGGWFEIKEFDIESQSQAHDARGEALDENHIFRRWARVIFGALERLGKPGTQSRDHGIAEALGAAGFVDVVEHRWPIPIGTWPREPKMKEVGAFNHHYLDESLEGFSVYLLKEVLGWEYAEIVAFVEEMRLALKDRRLAPYLNL
ncbi:methyltransferase domain-containing protein [Colletotrichum plurivorum]|uniref:Methyltransferase domain-containing protein n=1 Tax=Colletotrichum plurivorum TaxID=2175906 RepID=A0A8H6JZ60_9PEZI|nr:methyltransferase domain-containing protein [Colletotrichum plurivorum]